MSMTVRPERASARLAGAQRAAALILALGEDRASRLLSRLEDHEVRDVSAAMASLGTLPAATVEDLCQDFAEELGNSGALVGSWETTERMLTSSLPRERVVQIMEEIRGPSGRTIWEKLGNVNEAVLANYLKNEHPQTVAVVLAKLESEHAARVLTQLPHAFAMEVVTRMLRMESPQAEALEQVERTLRVEFMSNLARSSRRDAHERMAEIFNNLDRAAEARMLADLELAAADSAARIRALMFTFDDLRRLDEQGMQVLLRVVEKDRLALALKGANEALREMFLKSMSERAGRMLKDDMAALGAVRRRDVEAAQAAIVVQAKELAQQGEIRLTQGKDEEMVQ